MIEELISNKSFNCRICLWTFESESELNIHNYLEHVIINHAEHKKIVQDTQVHHANIHLVNSNNLIRSKSISQSRDEIESEVYDEFLSIESLREEDMYQNMNRRKQHDS